jgi:hypothetical protein
MATTPDDLPETGHDVRPVVERVPVPARIAERYEVGALLGEGGMGEVRECRDLVLAPSTKASLDIAS